MFERDLTEIEKGGSVIRLHLFSFGRRGAWDGICDTLDLTLTLVLQEGGNPWPLQYNPILRNKEHLSLESSRPWSTTNYWRTLERNHAIWAQTKKCQQISPAALVPYVLCEFNLSPSLTLKFLLKMYR